MGRMKDVGSPPVVKLKVEHMGLTAEELAVQKAEAMQNSLLKQQDSAAYRAQAASERSKARELNAIMVQLKERKRNPPVRVRRMDPLVEYDEQAVRVELRECKIRAAAFEELANQYNKEAQDMLLQISNLDRRLNDLNKSGKTREATEVKPDG